MKQYQVLFKNEKDEEIIKNAGAKIVFPYKNIKKVLGIEASEDVAELLRSHSEIEAVIEDVADEEDEQQESYAIEMLNAREFWKSGFTGKGVKIAVLDGGCQQHEDLKIAGGYNVQNPHETYLSDVRDHGTHVAGIINMQDNDKGYIGVAPDAELYIVKLDDNRGGGNNGSAQIEGINWCIENDIDIISMSISSETDNPARNEAFRAAAVDHGIICVTSAGNTHRDQPMDKDTIRYPAKLPYVVGVGNLDEHKSRWVSSSIGFGLDISAPGTRIMSTVPDYDNEISRNYGSKTGTSMATPYVAGMFALYKERFPYLSREDLIDKVKENAEFLGDPREYGAGLIRPPKEISGSTHERYYVRDLEGNEYPLQATVTHDFELNGNQSLSFTVLPTKVNKLFISEIKEMWEVVDEKDVVHKIVYAKKTGQGSYKRQYKKDEPETTFLTPVQTIENGSSEKQLMKSTQLNVEIKAIPMFFDTMDNRRIEDEYNEHMTAHRAFSLIFDGMPFSFAIVDQFDAVQWEGFGGGESRLDTFKRALERYKCEFRISGNTVYLESRIGRDTSIMYCHKLNASNVVKEIDAQENYTYAKGYGDFGEGGEEGSGDWQDAQLIVEYTSPLAKVIGIREAPPIKDGRVTNETTMRNSLKALVDESLKISITADIHDLTKQGYPIAQSEVGDRVFVIDERINANEEVRVVNQSVTKNWRGDIIAVNLTFGSEGISKRHQSNLTTAAKSINELFEGRRQLPFTALDSAVRNATNALKSAQTELKFENGIIAQEKNDPNRLVLFNSKGIGVSVDGGQSFETAMTADGFVADLMTVGTLKGITIDGVEIYGSRIEGVDIYGSRFYQSSGDREIQIRNGSVYSYYEGDLAMSFGQYKLDFYNKSGTNIGSFGPTYVEGDSSVQGLTLSSDSDYLSIAHLVGGLYRSAFRTVRYGDNRGTVVAGAYAFSDQSTSLGLYANARIRTHDISNSTDQAALILSSSSSGNDANLYFGGLHSRTDDSFYIRHNVSQTGSNRVLRAHKDYVRVYNELRVGSENHTIKIMPYSNSVHWRFDSNNYIRQGEDGQVSFYANGERAHAFFPDGTKSGGSIIIDGENLGMSPTDSPQILIEYIEFDVDLSNEKTKIYLDSKFVKAVDNYAVFLNNGQVVEKGNNYFVIEGTGIADCRIIGERTGYRGSFWSNMSADLEKTEGDKVDDVA